MHYRKLGYLTKLCYFCSYTISEPDDSRRLKTKITSHVTDSTEVWHCATSSRLTFLIRFSIHVFELFPSTVTIFIKSFYDQNAYDVHSRLKLDILRHICQIALIFGIFIKTVQLIILFTRVLSLGVNEIVYTWKIIQNMLMHPIKSYNGKNSVQFSFYKWVFHRGVYVTTHVW